MLEDHGDAGHDARSTGQGLPGRGWHLVASVGGAIARASFLVFCYVVRATFRRGERVPANPWGEGATTPECQVGGPSPFHTYEKPPRVR